MSISPEPRRRRRGGAVLIPAFALIAGLLLGTYGGALLQGADHGLLPFSTPTTTTTVTVTASPPPPPPGTSRLTVDVPDDCVVVAERGAGVASKLNDAVEAARRLQLDRARQLLAEIELENPGELARTAERCRSAVEALTAPTQTPAVP